MKFGVVNFFPGQNAIAYYLLHREVLEQEVVTLGIRKIFEADVVAVLYIPGGFS
jgi:hypothetical protein